MGVKARHASTRSTLRKGVDGVVVRMRGAYSPPVRIALATQRDLPDWEQDDLPFHAALRELGVDLHRPIWDDPEVKWHGYDGCLIRTTWDYMDKAEAFRAWAERVDERIPLFNPAAVVRWNLDKRYLRTLERRGVPHMPTVWIEPGAPIDVAQTMRARGWSRGFLKPVVGCSAQGTLRFSDTPAELADAQQHLESRLQGSGTGMMLQPYLASVERDGEVSALFFDGVLSHGVRKVPVPGDYRVQDDYGASDEPYTFTESELALATHARETAESILGLSGPLLYARADFLRADDGTLRITELELIEPSLFFRHDPAAPMRLARALVQRLGG